MIRMSTAPSVAALLAVGLVASVLGAGSAHAGDGACANASSYGPGAIVGGALGAAIGRNADDSFGAAIGGLVASQIGRCTESAIVTRREKRQQQQQQVMYTGQPSAAWIETDNRGNQMVCQNALVEVTMPTGIVLRDTKKICQGISSQIITSSN